MGMKIWTLALSSMAKQRITVLTALTREFIVVRVARLDTAIWRTTQSAKTTTIGSTNGEVRVVYITLARPISHAASWAGYMLTQIRIL